MSSSDGLHNDEITKLLFKSYMNSTTTSNRKHFTKKIFLQIIQIFSVLEY